ncbi:hypothetical protein BOTNAR_0318g00110 [Botryotinia narcissicola]|uniref:RING-type domain-containing protein n=1 Tax=Botryotinia narcissicola TaxID=278944 RepID=A0A4Z1HUI4_9HELO|nr:hypothetical protein BOTNAR_0318g00110 [Botryotinia narcissicola]
MDLNSFITLQIDVLLSNCNILLQLIFWILIYIDISTIVIRVTREHQRNQNTGKLAIQSTPVMENDMYNITSTTGIAIGYLNSIFETSTNSHLKMESRNRKIERNPLAALIAISFFSLIIITTFIYQLQNYLLNPQPFQPKTTHSNTQDSTLNKLINPIPPAAHDNLEPPQANQQKVIIYFNPRFQGIPDLQQLRKQVRENMDAIFAGAMVPWPEIMQKGFGYTTMAEIDREMGLQRRGGGAAQDANANGAFPRDGGDTPGWMLALFERGYGDGNGNADVDASASKKKEEEKSTCPICMNELPTRAAIARPCKHRFCTMCLEDWMEHSRGMERGKGKGKGEGQKIRCPVCGVRIRRVGRGGGLMDRVDRALRRVG